MGDVEDVRCTGREEGSLGDGGTGDRVAGEEVRDGRLMRWKKRGLELEVLLLRYMVRILQASNYEGLKYGSRDVRKKRTR